MYNTQIYHPQGLGLVATSRRNIRSGREYAHFFGSASAETKIVKGDADVSDTVSHALAMIKRDAPTVAKLANHLRGDSLQQTCKNIFNFMYWHYQYKIDTPGQEQLRTPTRAWKDRATGIDCDCYSISVGALLTALNIPFALRIIKMYNKAFYQHIYVVVPKTKGADISSHSNYWVIDPVLDGFDKEAPYTDKKDYPMQLAELSGITPEGTDIGREFDGFGTTCDGTIGSYNARMRNHIVNTRNAVVKSPAKVKGFYNPQKFVAVADKVIANWHNPVTREAALEWASSVEMGIVDENMEGLQGLMHDDEHDLHTHMNGDLDYLQAISGIDLSGLTGDDYELSGKVKDKLKAKVVAVAAKVAPAKVIAAAKAKIAPKAAIANATKKGMFTKIKNAGKNLKQVADKAKGKLNKDLVKNVVKKIQKVNPVAVAVRNAFLAAMNLNVGNFSDKLALAYGSASEAEKAGYNFSQLVNAKNEIERIFVNIAGGNADALKKAIINRKHLIHKQVHGMQGLGIVVAAATTAAASPLLAKVAAILAKIIKNPAKLAKAKNLVNKIAENKDLIKEKAQQLIKAKTGASPDVDQEMVFNPNNAQNETPNTPDSDVPNNEGGMYDPNNSNDGKSGFPVGKSNTLLIVGGVVVGGLALIAATGGFSGKGKAVSGVKKAGKKSTQISI